MTIDVVSDIMCPWCFIGKRNLETAIAQSPEIEFEVNWRPYQLDATLPPEGKDRSQYLNDKFGGEERAKEIYGRIYEAGKNVGIDFKFDDIAVSPNTLIVHRLIHYSATKGKDIQDKLVTILFENFFLEGKNVGDKEILIKAGEKAGLNATELAAYLDSDQDVELIEKQIAQAQQMGVTGVPFFIIDLKHAIPGAVPSETLVQAFQQISAAE